MHIGLRAVGARARVLDFREQAEQGSEIARGACGMASAPLKWTVTLRAQIISAVIALLLLARELFGHRLDRELRGLGTLFPNLRARSSYSPDLNPRTPGRVLPRRSCAGTGSGDTELKRDWGPHCRRMCGAGVGGGEGVVCKGLGGRVHDAEARRGR